MSNSTRHAPIWRWADRSAKLGLHAALSMHLYSTRPARTAPRLPRSTRHDSFARTWMASAAELAGTRPPAAHAVRPLRTHASTTVTLPSHFTSLNGALLSPATSTASCVFLWVNRKPTHSRANTINNNRIAGVPVRAPRTSTPTYGRHGASRLRDWLASDPTPVAKLTLFPTRHTTLRMMPSCLRAPGQYLSSPSGHLLDVGLPHLSVVATENRRPGTSPPAPQLAAVPSHRSMPCPARPRALMTGYARAPLRGRCSTARCCTAGPQRC